MPYRLHPTGALDVAAEDYADLSEAQARIEDRPDEEPSE